MWEDNETKVLFRLKKGCGSHVFSDDRGTISQGQTFHATPFEVRNITAKIEPLEPVPEEQPEPVEPRFDIVHKGGGWYSVINVITGEALNDKALKKTEAQALAGIEIDDTKRSSTKTATE